MGTVGRVLFVSGVVFACGYGLHRYQRRKQWESERSAGDRERQARELEECMLGVWSEPRDLIADVRQGLHGPADQAAHAANGRMLEVSLTPTAQRDAWSIAKYLSKEGRTQDRESAIRTMLQQIVAPGCDWSNGWQPYRNDPRFRDVYESTGNLLDLAELALKYAPRSTTAGRGALVCPGWVHEKPAPTADVRPGDFVEVMVDEYSEDPEYDSRHAEWAWVRVESLPKDGENVAGHVSLEAPPADEPNILRNTTQHGFDEGTAVLVPRRCVFRVAKAK